MACGDADFADAVLDAATTAQDGTPEHVVRPHATDAGWVAQAGTDCVIVGAASPSRLTSPTRACRWPSLSDVRTYLSASLRRGRPAKPSPSGLRSGASATVYVCFVIRKKIRRTVDYRS